VRKFEQVYRNEVQRIYKLEFGAENNVHSITDVLREYSQEIKSTVSASTFLNKKCQLQYAATFKRDVVNTFITKTFESKQYVVMNKADLEEFLACSGTELNEQFENFTENGSGYSLERNLWVKITVTKYSPFLGSSYIKTPLAIVKKNCVINVKNEDAQCFKWAILSAIHPVDGKDHPDRVTKYVKYENELEFGDIEFPVDVDRVSKFEKLNPKFSVNVFLLDKDEIVPLRASVRFGREHVIDLLLLREGDKSHYVWVKSLSGFLRGKYSKHHGAHLYCRRCLCFVTHDKARLAEHVVHCQGISKDPQRVQMPEDVGGKYKDGKIKFSNHHHSMKAPFVIYADFEAYNCDAKSYDVEMNTNTLTNHVPNSFSYVIVGLDGRPIKEPYLFRAESDTDDIARMFVNRMVAERDEIVDRYFRNPVEMRLSSDEQTDFEESVRCYVCETGFADIKTRCVDMCGSYAGAICSTCPRTGLHTMTKLSSTYLEEKFRKETNCAECDRRFADIKVRDHCHVTGKYRGAACGPCNLKMRVTENTRIPVVLHNLKGYDSHFIMQAIGKTENVKKNLITCIGQTNEKYVTFSLGSLRFIDSLQFLASSLDKLAKSLTKNEYSITDLYSKHDILKRKGVYPYEWIQSCAQFEETSLPKIEDFYSRLRAESITKDEYEHAHKVWSECGCKTFGDYHDLYLKSDVLLLADIFEAFRKTSLKHYGLDPAHYLTSPALSWDAMLKTTRVELEYIQDIDMYMFFERGTRGGISMVAKRYSKANNKYVKGYDKSKPSKYISYIDANNLYGWAMSQFLPTGKFRWLSPEESSAFQERLSPEESNKGYVIECDITYPENLHELHNDYPLACESMEVQRPWLSGYQEGLLGDKNLGKCRKLVPNLMSKKNYVVHYRNLQQYLALGLRVTKIHRVLEFEQKPFMKSYIELNTELRKKAKTDFEKDFFKLMNNSCFGKTMEDVRKRKDIRLIRSSDVRALNKKTASPLFQSMHDFGDELTAVRSSKKVVVLDKPIYVGMVVLELSKFLMNEFWYEHVKTKYGNKAQLLYTDTDSFIFEVECEDIYADMKENEDLYDFSDWPRDHALFDEKNKKVIGKFKDEVVVGKFATIAEFVGLRPKMYAMRLTDESEKRRAKGVSSTVVRKQIAMDLYMDCLENKKTFCHKNISIRHENHHLKTMEVNKISLSPLDTKRYIMENGVETLAYGHYKIESKFCCTNMARPINQRDGGSESQDEANDEGIEYDGGYITEFDDSSYDSN